MHFEATEIPDVVLIRPRVIGDERGFFMESWEERKFSAARLNCKFVQDNHSRSTRHTLRGVHYQIQQVQGKLVRVVHGSVIDVAVDIRRGSPTFGRSVGAVLSEENHHIQWIPPGFAHGFLVFSARADLLYRCTDFWAPCHERAIIWNDPDLHVPWPLPSGIRPLLSMKDAIAARFRDAELFPCGSTLSYISPRSRMLIDSLTDRMISSRPMFLALTHCLRLRARCGSTSAPSNDIAFIMSRRMRFLDRSTPTENARYAPNSPYAAIKAAADHLVRAYHRTYGLAVTTTNCVNNYGPYHFPEKLIPLMIVNILRGCSLPLYGDGSNTRDWLHVSDHCRAIQLILEIGFSGEIYNIGGAFESNDLHLVHLLCQLANEVLATHSSLASKYPQSPAARGKPTSSLIRFVRDRPGHNQRYALDSDKIERDCGFRSRISLEQGLRDTFTWYVQNDRWWRNTVDPDCDVTYSPYDSKTPVIQSPERVTTP